MESIYRTSSDFVDLSGFFIRMECQKSRQRFQLGGLDQNINEFTKRGFQLLAIAGQRVDGIKQYASKHPFPFPVLADEDRQVIKDYEVFVPLKWDSFRVATPSVYLLDEQHRIQYAYIGTSQFDRPEIEELIEAMDQI